MARFKVWNGNIEIIDMAKITENLKVSFNNDSVELTVPNQAGVALPSTGGPGTEAMVRIGMMLVSLAGIGLMMKRRKNKE